MHPNARVLYIHVPRTGGASVEAMLKQCGPLALKGSHMGHLFPCTPQHWHGEILQRYLPGEAFDAVFMTVRNPYARLESEYRYSARRVQGHGIRHALRRALVPSLPRWIERMIRAFHRNPYVSDNHLRPQHEFLCHDPRIFRIEDGLDDIRQWLERQVGLDAVPAPVKTNAADWVNLEVKWTPRVRRLVADFYSRDFELFGYDPDAPSREPKGADRAGTAQSHL